MITNGNTILITGGGSGIGRALAGAFHAAGNRVIVAGRRKAALDETVAANPGMDSIVLDVADAADIQAVAAKLVQDHPSLNVLINNAGIMRIENVLAEPVDLTDAEASITSNLLGPIRLTAALLPHLRRQARSTIINVSSGLAFVPMAAVPTYNATKAAIHSYTQSLRFQLRETSVEVIELVPPGVATELLPGHSANPRAMPVDDYIRESMALLNAEPSTPEICVQGVMFLRKAEANGQFDATFNAVNASH